MSSRIGRSAQPGGLALGRFFAVGIVAAAVDVGLAVGLVEAGLGRFLGDVVALGVAAVVARALHGRLTLRGDDLDRWIRQPPVFVTVVVVTGAVDVAVFVSLGSLSTLAAKLCALACAASLRAVTHRLVLFRAVRREQSRPAHRAVAPGGPRLSVVVPAFREEGRIAATVGSLRAELGDLDTAHDLEIVVVDDGSPDRTAEVARAAGADIVVEQPRNLGKGAAVRAGIVASTGRTVAFTDADLAYAPAQLRPMLDAVEAGWDVVIGDRHADGSEAMVGTSALRSFGSRVVNMASQIMLLGNYRDTQCGCKAFRSDVARLVSRPGRIDGFAFDIEILHLVERYGLSLKEVPVAVVNSDTSTVRAIRDGLAAGRDIIRIRWIASRGGYPPVPDGALPTADRA